MADVIPLKKWPGGIGEMVAGDRIPYAFLGIGGQLGGHRNKIINGKMEIAQRGAVTTSVSASSYAVDRIAYRANTTAVVTLSQQLDAPPGGEFQFSSRVEVTTARPTVSQADAASLQQRVEGYSIRDLVGRTFTLSFWVKSSLSGTHCVSFSSGGAGLTYVAEYVVNAPNTWEFNVVTVVGGLPTSWAWNFLDGHGMRVAFALCVGSSYQTVAGSWQPGSFLTTANQVNCLGAVGNTFAITGLQLEVGPVATPFEHRPYSVELSLCERYYEVVRWGVQWVSGGSGPSHSLGAPIAFRQQKRAAPTISTIATNTSVNANNLLFGAISAYGAYGEVEPAAANTCKLIVDLAISSEL